MANLSAFLTTSFHTKLSFMDADSEENLEDEDDEDDYNEDEDDEDKVPSSSSSGISLLYLFIMSGTDVVAEKSEVGMCMCKNVGCVRLPNYTFGLDQISF